MEERLPINTMHFDNQTQKVMDGNTFIYSYNKDNQVTNITKNNNLDTKITYNQFGDMTEVKQPNGTVKYQYDEIGRRVGLTYADGTKTSYEYDKNDNLLTIKTGTNTTSYQYDAIGNVTQKTLPNGTVTSYSYNDNNQIATIKTMTSLGTILTNMEYVYDERGNIISEKETVDGKTTDKTYTYDEEERLASSTHTTGMNKKEYAYSYDMVGNKTSMSETTNGKITNRQYQFDSNNALTNDAGSRYEYDINGNVSKKTYKNGVVETFKYDSEGQLIKTESSIGKTITYAYDGLGNRTQKVEKTTIEQSEGSSFLAFLKTDNSYNEDYDQQLVSQTTNEQLINLHQTISDHLDTFNQTCPVDDEDGPKTSVTTINYINDINRPYTEVLQTTNKNNQTVHTYVYGNERLSDTKRGESTNYYAYDGKGSVVGQQTTTNTVALSFKVSYNDFGQANRKMDNQYGYNGESHDYNGTQYLRARYYDTKTGTFGQQDSFLGDQAVPLSLNRFSYSHNNPINMNDPSGYAAGRAGKTIAGQPSGKMCLDSRGNLYSCDNTPSISKPGYQTSSGLSGGGTNESYQAYTDYWNKHKDDPNSYYYDMMAATEQRKKEREAERAALLDDVQNEHGVQLGDEFWNMSLEDQIRYLREIKKLCDEMDAGYFTLSEVQEAANALLATIKAQLPANIPLGTLPVTGFEMYITPDKQIIIGIATGGSGAAAMAWITATGATVSTALSGAFIPLLIGGAIVFVPATYVIYQGSKMSPSELAMNGASSFWSTYGYKGYSMVKPEMEAALKNGTMSEQMKIWWEHLKMLAGGGGGSGTAMPDPDDSGRTTNPSKNESEIWKKLDRVKGTDRRTSGKGSNKKYYEWDNTHNDIEVYDRRGNHLGSMDPTTGEMYKPAVPGRTINP